MTQNPPTKLVTALASPAISIDPAGVELFDRGSGIVTVRYVGKWNSRLTTFTTGVTRFAPGTGLPLHLHNVEESVLVLTGDAIAEVGDERIELVAGQATWVPANTPHRFLNRGGSEMSIYWVYGGRDVTRTIIATGETFVHLSPDDRGGELA